MSGFTFSILVLILALFATAGLMLYTLWSTQGWWFAGSCMLSATIAGIGVHALPEWWGLLKQDLEQ